MRVAKQVFRLLGMAIKDVHSRGWQTVAPSAIGYRVTEASPVAMDDQAIQK
jgi:hypothetical protein